MSKTYEAADLDEFREIILKIIIGKIEEIAPDKKIKIIVNGDVDERKN